MSADSTGEVTEEAASELPMMTLLLVRKNIGEKI
jgi:hypothetical protein